MDETNFPLILLKPVADELDNWVAVEIGGLIDGTPANVSATQHLFMDMGLAAAIPNIAYRLPAVLIAALDLSTYALDPIWSPSTSASPTPVATEYTRFTSAWSTPNVTCSTRSPYAT